MKKEKLDKKSKIRDEKGRLLKGHHIGRPVGSFKDKTFVQYMDEITNEIAEKNNISPEEVRRSVYLVGYKKAREGNSFFYKDFFDRIYGKAIQPLSNPDGSSIGVPIIPVPKDAIQPQKNEEFKKEKSKET